MQKKSAIGGIIKRMEAASAGFVAFTASNIQDVSGKLLAAGTLEVLPTDGNDFPITAAAGGAGGQMSNRVPAVFSITSGVLQAGAQIADTTQTKPANICYRFTIRDASGNPIDILKLVQTSANTAFNLDTYQPNVGAQAVVQTSGPAGLNGTNGTNGTNGATGTVGNASALTVGPTAAIADATGYSSVNSGGFIGAGTALSAGVGVFKDTFGVDFDSGTARGYGTRLFAPAANQSVSGYCGFAFTSGAAPIANQTQFTVPVFCTSVLFTMFGATIDASGNFATPGALKGASLKAGPGQGATPPANTGGYATVNQSLVAGGGGLLAPGNALSAGLGLWNDGNGIARYGIDFAAGTLGFRTRLFCNTADSIAFAFSTAGYYTALTDFTEPYSFKISSATILGNNIDNAGNLTMMARGGVAASDAQLPSQLATLVQARSIIASESALGHSGYVVPWAAMGFALHTYGDSITAGTGATNAATTSWVAVLAAALGVAVTNNGVGGSLASDVSAKIFSLENGTVASKLLHTLAVGTNDVNLHNPANVPVFNKFHQASIAWLGTRAENRVLGNTVTATNWAADTTYAAVTGAQSSTNAAAITYSIATSGGPIYLWTRLLAAATGGSCNVSVDGGAAIALNTFDGNAATNGVQLLRIPVAPGTHTVAITVTSATGTGSVTVMALGTPSAHTYYTSPTVAVGGVIPQNTDTYSAQSDLYTSAILDNVVLLQGDGLDVRYVDNRVAMASGNPAIYYDGLHPNDTGHAAIAPHYLTVLRRSPARSVNRATPPSSAGFGTPGDAWSAAGFVYGVQSYNSIFRTAVATW